MVADTPEVLLTEIVVSKLEKMLGEAKAAKLIDELFSKLGKQKVQTPDELKRVAADLIGRGGLTKLIGQSIMTEALLRGARS